MTEQTSSFDYNTAFSRNIGWITQGEQQRIRAARVAIAGAGGVGGIHLQTLARLGFSDFHVADLDRFELANFNRQAGATVDTLGLPKAEVAQSLVKAINPDASVRVFPKGVTEENLPEFLSGVDVYIDGLDFFVLALRAKLFDLARQKGITAITAAPIGMGAGYVSFTPDSMSFDAFFKLGENPDTFEGSAAFLLGLTPAMLQRSYLADPSRVDLPGQRGPSTAIACQLCAGIAATQAVKAVLKRGPLKPAPYYHHFDAYLGRFVSRKLHGGAANPVQRVKRALVTRLTRHYAKSAQPPEQDASPQDSILMRILEAARWAPSADNTQPWTFHVHDDAHFTIQVRYDDDHIYEYRGGEPVRLACGMMLQNLTLRAARFDRQLTWHVENAKPGLIDISCTLVEKRGLQPSTLEAMIESRSTYRAMLKPKALPPSCLERLEAAVGHGYKVAWHASLKERWAHAMLNARAASVRLRTPETIPVHQNIVRFDTPFPRWGLPSRGLGLSGLAHGLMRFAFASKARSKLLLGWLGGAFYAALEMDILPGVFSSAHFTLTSAQPLSQGETEVEEDLNKGAAIQRLWLAASAEGLAFQPACAPICFYDYGLNDKPFTRSKTLQKAARRFANRFEAFYNADADKVFYRGRIGYAPVKAGQPRSLRTQLKDLIVEKAVSDEHLDKEAPEERLKTA